MRKATEDELRSRANENTRKAKGLALVIETSQSFDQFRLPETRVTMRIKAAQLLWPSDEKKASALMAEAIETIKQLVADNVEREQDYGDYRSVTNLRQQVIAALAPHDPEAALKFLQSTRMPADDLNHSYDQEVQLESSLIDQVVAANPKRAFELAEDLLKRSSSQGLIQTVTQLAAKDRELGCRLARDIAKKIESQDFMKDAQAAYLSTSLLQVVKNIPIPAKDGANTKPGRLLTDDEFRELFLKLVSELMSYQSSEQNLYTPDYSLARNLAAAIGQMNQEVKTYAPDRADAISKKIAELGLSANQPGMEWQRYQAAINKEPIEAALESVEQAPAPIRDYLYQQVVSRVAATGDVQRARQIVSERLTNAGQRKQMLHTLQVQAVSAAAEKGNIDEALRLLSKFSPSERNALIDQVVDRIGPDVKRSQALQYLEQARNLVNTSVRAEDSQQMQTLLTIARAFGRHDLNRSFQIVEPLIDQFNEISAAAVTMNGFGNYYYVEGELTTSDQNPVADAANQISDTLATLAMFDFDRAKRNADRISRMDARVRTYLMIAARTLEAHVDWDAADAEPND